MTNCNGSRRTYREVVGLLPMAGKATRRSRLPYTKELNLIDFQNLTNGRAPYALTQALLPMLRSRQG